MRARLLPPGAQKDGRKKKKKKNKCPAVESGDWHPAVKSITAVNCLEPIFLEFRRGKKGSFSPLTASGPINTRHLSTKKETDVFFPAKMTAASRKLEPGRATPNDPNYEVFFY